MNRKTLVLLRRSASINTLADLGKSKYAVPEKVVQYQIKETYKFLKKECKKMRMNHIQRGEFRFNLQKVLQG